jgi:hypothetical protein
MSFENPLRHFTEIKDRFVSQEEFLDAVKGIMLAYKVSRQSGEGVDFSQLDRASFSLEVTYDVEDGGKPSLNLKMDPYVRTVLLDKIQNEERPSANRSWGNLWVDAPRVELMVKNMDPDYRKAFERYENSILPGKIAELQDKLVSIRNYRAQVKATLPPKYVSWFHSKAKRKEPTKFNGLELTAIRRFLQLSQQLEQTQELHRLLRERFKSVSKNLIKK